MESKEKPQTEDLHNPYKPPESFHRQGRRSESDTSGKTLRKKIQADERLVLTWLTVMGITFVIGSMFRIGVVIPDPWDNWMINWQSNLCLYVSILSLVVASRYGLRSAAALKKLKVLEHQKTSERD